MKGVLERAHEDETDGTVPSAGNSAPPETPTLVVSDSGVAVHSLRGKSIVLGRAASADVVIRDPSEDCDEPCCKCRNCPSGSP